MRGLRWSFFTTGVGRRIVLLLAAVAAVPLTVLGTLSYRAVSEQLREQSEARILQVAKATGMVLAERLQLLDQKLRIVGSRTTAGLDGGSMEGFLALVPEDRAPPGGSLSSAERAHLAEGLGLLRVGTDDKLVLGVEGFDGRLLWARVDPDFLWSTAEAYADLGPLALFCVLRADGRPLHCDSPRGAAMAQAFPGSRRAASHTFFAWSDMGREYLGAHWELFLQPSHMAAPWTILVSEDQELAFQAMDGFRLTLPLALLAAMATVVLVASVEIRRTTEPLEELQRGARRIGGGELDARVAIASGDEFEEVGATFNEMGARLGLQFRHLEAAREIDHAVLSSTDPRRVIRTLLDHFGRVVPCDDLAVLVLDEAGEALRHRRDGYAEPEGVLLDVSARRRLMGSVRRILNGSTDEMPAGLRLSRGATRGSLILPLVVQRELRAVIVAEREAPFTSEEAFRARQLADQAGVALAGAWLVADLDEMSWGTLRALAGAIDAKSPWTAGHSDRVTVLAVALGRRLGLSDDDLLLLERGSLLHDVGKIGVPSEILNKPGRLTDEEFATMSRHPAIGEDILEPIRAFRPLLPLVRHHHERWDGAGYPDGLTGPETHPLARILAVADVFDAMTSPRPYRGALAEDTVLRHLREEAGRAFDPEVVAALLRIKEQGDDTEASAAFADAGSWDDPASAGSADHA